MSRSGISWDGGAVTFYARGVFVMRGPQIVKTCRTKRGARREAQRRALDDYERIAAEAEKRRALAAKRSARKEQEITDERHQVRATFDADSGIVEVFPTDPERTGFFLGVRPDVGAGAFVRVTAEQARQVTAKLGGADAV